jgi:Domain of unknown function (DUF4868)
MKHRPKSVKGDEQFLEILAKDLGKCNITVCLGSVAKDEGELKIEQLQLTEDLAKDFATAAEETVGRYRNLKSKDNLVQRGYDPGSKPDSHEVEFLNLAEHEAIAAQVESLSSLAKIPVFKIDEDFVKGIRFYVIVLQCGNGAPLYFFRVYTSKKELSRSRLFAALFEKGAFDRVTSPLFLFDHKVDALSYNGAMYIFNKHNFEKIFRFFELVAATANETLQTIRAHVPIANFEDFEKACSGHLQMQAKLKNIAGKPYLKEMTVDAIKKVLKIFPNLSIKIVKEGKQEKLRFDPKDKWALLRLLDDDYLGSILTGRNYEVTGKRPYES